MYKANGFNAYKNNSVNYASKDQLLLMLVDGAVKFSKIGRQAILDNDIALAHKNLIKVQDIFSELMATLDISKTDEWGKNLIQIYDFIIKMAAEANMKKDVQIIDNIIPLIEDISNTWHEAYKISKTQHV